MTSASGGRALLARRVIVTGGSQGLGRAIVEACGRAGANVLFCARSEAQMKVAREELQPTFLEGNRVVAQTCDVSDEGDVARLFARAEAEFGVVDAVINNAGIQAPIGLAEDNDWAEWRRCVEVNLFGTMLMCRAAIPIFKKAGRGKIVNLSGGGAAAPRARYSAYAASKAAVVRLTETLAEELREFHIDVNAVAPGALNTQMLAQTLAAGAEQAGGAAFAQAEKQADGGGNSMEKAAALCVYLASPESNGITGRLLSAPWDPWQTLHERREELAASDIFTLRRIVPEDRGKNWHE